MANSGQGKDDAKNLERLLEFLYNTETDDLGETKEILTDYGLDSHELVTSGMQLIRSLERNERIKIAKAKHKRLGEIFHKLKSVDVKQPIDEVRKRIDEIFEGETDSQLALAFYHKYERLSEEDIRNLLSDVELLDLLEEELKKLDQDSDE